MPRKHIYVVRQTKSALFVFVYLIIVIIIIIIIIIICHHYTLSLYKNTLVPAERSELYLYS